MTTMMSKRKIIPKSFLIEVKTYLGIGDIADFFGDETVSLKIEEIDEE